MNGIDSDTESDIYTNHDDFLACVNPYNWDYYQSDDLSTQDFMPDMCKYDSEESFLIGSPPTDNYAQQQVSMETAQNTEKLILTVPTQASKCRINLSFQENEFRRCFYLIFTKTKKKFPKNLVVKIHNLIANSLNLQKVSRLETRSIDLYFKDHAKNSEIILTYIQAHKTDLLEAIPELVRLK